MLTKEAVLDALRTVQEPELGDDLVSLDMIRDIRIEGERVSFTVVLTTPACPLGMELQERCEEAVRRLPGVREVSITMRADVRSAMAPERENLVPTVKNVVAVGSVKGGVGKSTVAVNVAVALAQTGAAVGLLDADVYGPDIPMMMGCDRAPVQAEGKLQPIVRHGVRFFSFGCLVPEETPIIWRGPLLHTGIRQLLKDVLWGELDYLIVDLPPGTGDVPLTLSQSVPLTGTVIVTTPQRAALRVALKALKMWRRSNVPILGLVENMSFFICPGCGTRYDIFDSGGAERAATDVGIPFLGRIPIDPRIRTGGDQGQPLIIADPQATPAVAFREIAARIAAQVSVRNLAAAVRD
ncbi:MAG: Mrp/NBP35 family ATP-binding protein [Nitrospira sp.]|nr:Mrp/NBP35 family ATP-binding protein [Nitrospira sp.]